MVQLKIYNFRMDDPTNTLLDGSARLGHTNRSQAVRDMILGMAELEQAAMAQQQEALATLVDQVGRDGYLVVFADTDEDGNPDVTIAGLRRGEKKGFYEGLKGVGHIVGDKLHTFLDFGELAPEPVVIGVGDLMIRIPCAQMALGPVSWPLKENEILRLPLHMLMRPVEEAAAAPAPAAKQKTEA